MIFPSHIYITGFMGSGKSTIGQILANVLGYGFIDLDERITQITGQDIPTFFKTQGEIAFRELEHQALQATILNNNVIIALGGGAFTQDRNVQWIKHNGFSVYLRLSLHHLFERLVHSKDRPLLFDPNGLRLSDEALQERILQLLNQRKRYYEQADLIIDLDNTSIGESVDIVVQNLREYLKETL